MPIGTLSPSQPRLLADWPVFLRARGKLLLWLGLVALLVAALIGWELRQSHIDARNASQLATQNLSLLLKEQLDGAFRETDLVLRDLAGKVDADALTHLDKLKPAERKLLAELLDEKLSTLPQVDSLAFLSSSGEWALSSEHLRRTDANQLHFFRQLRDNPGQELVFSPPLQLPGSRELGFVVARRIPTPSGTLGGVAVALVTLEYFNQLARRLEANEHSAFTLIDNDLMLVGQYPEMPEAIGKPVPNSTDMANWVNGRSNGYRAYSSPYDRVERGYSFRRLENFPFIVLVGLPEDAYFSDWRLKAAAYAAAYALLLLFSLAMGWRGWREEQLAIAVQLSKARLQEQDAYILRALETLSLPLLLVRADGDVILSANAAAAPLFGMPANALVGTPLPSLYARPDQHQQIVQQLTEHQAISEYEIQIHRADQDAASWIDLSGSVIAYRGEPAYFFSLQDISERKAKQETLWRKATLDPLTGIANRGYFRERAEGEWLRAKRYQHRLGVLMLDLDHFKAVNDSYGHDAGDQVLRAFTARIKAELRETDLFGRLGGEEFAVLAPEDNKTGMLELAERLRVRFGANAVPLSNGEMVSVTVSIGCAMSDPTVPDLDTLLKRADRALYAAKGAGRNQVMYFDPDNPVP